MEVKSVHVWISGLCALAGVALAAVQTFSPGAAPQGSINLTLSLDAAAARKGDRGTTVPKSAPAAFEAESPTALSLGAASFSAALNDGSDRRYEFRDLFDGRPDTALTIEPPDREINVLVDFGSGPSRKIAGLAYEPPLGAAGGAFATVFDVMVLPKGQLGAAGHPIMSFALPSAPGRQAFAFPEAAYGKGLWLRVAGPAAAAPVVVGEFRVLEAR